MRVYLYIIISHVWYLYFVCTCTLILTIMFMYMKIRDDKYMIQHTILYRHTAIQVSGRDPKACATATIGSYSLYRRLRRRHRFIYGIGRAGGLQRGRLVGTYWNPFIDVSYSRIKRIPCRSRPQARTATTAAADADNI